MTGRQQGSPSALDRAQRCAKRTLVSTASPTRAPLPSKGIAATRAITWSLDRAAASDARPSTRARDNPSGARLLTPARVDGWRVILHTHLQHPQQNDEPPRGARPARLRDCAHHDSPRGGGFARPDARRDAGEHDAPDRRVRRGDGRLGPQIESPPEKPAGNLPLRVSLSTLSVGRRSRRSSWSSRSSRSASAASSWWSARSAARSHRGIRQQNPQGTMPQRGDRRVVPSAAALSSSRGLSIFFISRSFQDSC